ncbi:uracil-DNA glycosylase family protein [soil metagenome]
MSQSTFSLIQQEIRQCTRCVDRGHIQEAHPILFGSPSARVMILGQAPGPTANQRPLPYSGATGRTLQNWLGRAGFEERALHDSGRFYLTSITKCFPGRSRSGKGDRAPSRMEIELCSEHLDLELRWIQPEIILALGKLSIGTMLPSLRNRPLASIVGNAYAAEYEAAGAARILPLPHPSGVSRWHNDPANQERLSLALERLSREKIRQGW